MPSIGKPSMRPRPWATRYSPAASSRANSTLRSAFEPYAYDPKKARQLLKEAGYANGFDAGEVSGDNVYAGVMEGAANDLTAVGIRIKVRPMERAAAFAAHREKTFKNLTFQGSGAFGNAATRLEAFATSQGSQSWIKDPEIDAWYAQQAGERDRTKARSAAA